MTIRIAVAADRNRFTVTRVAEVPAKAEDGVFYVEREDDLDAVPDEVLDASYAATHAASKVLRVRDRTEAKGFWMQSLKALSHRNGSTVEMTEASEAGTTSTTDSPSTTEAADAPSTNETSATTTSDDTKETETMPATATKTRKVTKPAAKKNAAKEKAPRQPKAVAFEPGAKSLVKPVRAGSKLATLIDLLSKGATLEQVDAAMAERGKDQGGRVWLSYLSRNYGYGIEQRDNGKLYLVLPKGVDEVPAHKVAENKTEAKKAEKKAGRGKRGGKK